MDSICNNNDNIEVHMDGICNNNNNNNNNIGVHMDSIYPRVVFKVSRTNTAVVVVVCACAVFS